MDVVWSERHHLVACCAMDENALPLLAFVGGEENAPPKVPQEKAPLGGWGRWCRVSLATFGVNGNHKNWKRMLALVERICFRTIKSKCCVFVGGRDLAHVEGQ